MMKTKTKNKEWEVASLVSNCSTRMMKTQGRDGHVHPGLLACQVIGSKRGREGWWEGEKEEWKKEIKRKEGGREG